LQPVRDLNVLPKVRFYGIWLYVMFSSRGDILCFDIFLRD
jgi:hypothetical protein